MQLYSSIYHPCHEIIITLKTHRLLLPSLGSQSVGHCVSVMFSVSRGFESRSPISFFGANAQKNNSQVYYS